MHRSWVHLFAPRSESLLSKMLLSMQTLPKLTKMLATARSKVAVPLALYRVGFGPPARNRKKYEKYRFRAPEILPRKIG